MSGPLDGEILPPPPPRHDPRLIHDFDGAVASLKAMAARRADLAHYAKSTDLDFEMIANLFNQIMREREKIR